MPLYEYECEECGRRVERLQKFSDAPLTTCESCGGALQRLVSSPAIQFKGSGWYVTDYAKKSAAPSSSSPGDSPASGDKKEEKKEKGTPKAAEPAKASTSKTDSS